METPKLFVVSIGCGEMDTLPEDAVTEFCRRCDWGWRSGFSVSEVITEKEAKSIEALVNGKCTLKEVTEEYEFRVTKSPECYDGFGTKSVDAMPPTKGGKPWRMVAIEKKSLYWQEMRYSSGLGCSFTMEKFEECRDIL